MQSIALAPAVRQAFGCLSVCPPSFLQSSTALSRCTISPILLASCLHSVPFKRSNSGVGNLPFEFKIRVPNRRRFQVCALQAAAKSEKWLLEPVGDGSSRHLNKAVPLPSAFELVSDATTVGRVSDKSDIAISIDTVSRVHACLEKKDGSLYVTDLGSTNGTYVNGKRIKPQTAVSVPPGSRVTFGDDHLAAFRFSKVEEDLPSLVEQAPLSKQAALSEQPVEDEKISSKEEV
eukprot:c23307_g2_i1 orf=186-884(+)